ncbi:uncharacterized protein BX664DRAFT_318939 [Halteromyces radiatus]|uniref:uncharacterized protein n=1 Tax=Halteromyces radiatus TaxID=101107 RepID=UPI00221F219D|nr:uncharacterized protein BX664DRAFT_318939 [Halteromyces radiatus]KAI8098525.1 hypothetical protein BX664DRAFT_318939 [Halteromyces radiatus]
MYSSSPQSCQYYSNTSDNNNTNVKHEHHGKYNSDNNNVVNSDTGSTPSWHQYDNDYSLGSPTPSTSPSFPLQHYSSMLTPTSTPYVLSHSTSALPPTHHFESTPNNNNNINSTGLGTPLNSHLPSYGYGLSHRGFFPRPKLTTTLWEDERTICFQVDANGICVARREDNDMINGTKLLNVAGMSRGKRDGILKNEKGRVVVKVGAMHLKGVWITFDRAKILSAQFKIQDILYPLFVDNPQTFLYSHPITSPISRLGPFRPYFSSSWDRTLSSPTTPTTPTNSNASSTTTTTTSSLLQPQHGLDSSDTNIAAPLGYRTSGSLPPHSSASSFGSSGNHDLLPMDYRSGGSTSDGLTDQLNSTSSTSHGSASSYYNDLLDTNHRANDLAIYDTSNNNSGREPNKMMTCTSSSPRPTSHSLLANSESSILLDTSKRSNSGLQSPSAFQALDTTNTTTTFHHPQPIYMDPANTSSSSRDHYHQQFHLSSSHINPNNNNSNSILNDLSSPNITSSSTNELGTRRDNLVMNHHLRNGTQRHHPYANCTTSPPPLPKLSSTQEHSGSLQLKKPSISRHHHPPPPLNFTSSTRNLAKDTTEDISLKTNSDHTTRPW